MNILSFTSTNQQSVPEHLFKVMVNIHCLSKLGQCTYAGLNVAIAKFDWGTLNLFKMKEGTTNLYLFFLTPDIHSTMVVKHVDFVAMVSAVGGSAGLFLGFSMLACCMQCFDLTIKKILVMKIPMRADRPVV